MPIIGEEDMAVDAEEDQTFEYLLPCGAHCTEYTIHTCYRSSFTLSTLTLFSHFKR
jgi:hypothetical protein